ncbi:MAG: hypothetical protein EOO36_10785 [Cytophagaceae bacterium]|nr:MAG: hypothetical protein EOO36_10785 [Cytophagaceae bacterium]
MLLPLLRSAALAAAFSLASLAASAQTFGEFLTNPELPVTFMGADYSAVRYYGPPLTVDAGEMKGLFIKINDLLVQESGKYDIASALRRKNPPNYAIFLAESVNQRLDTTTLIVPRGQAPRPAFTVQTIERMVGQYNYPAGSAGVGLVLVVESIEKNEEQEVFWATFVDMSTKRLLYTEKMGGTGNGFGFRNHWAHGLNDGIKTMKSHYGQWKKKVAKS